MQFKEQRFIITKLAPLVKRGFATTLPANAKILSPPAIKTTGDVVKLKPLLNDNVTSKDLLKRFLTGTSILAALVSTVVWYFKSTHRRRDYFRNRSKMFGGRQKPFW
ncbi:hypothetical protein GJ496_012015 [Pomphorhynchus laevis]|nr:hypothetical protein GJ496_012015 [Pomphorhynchus laevis]